MPVIVDTEKCTGCGECLTSCPVEAIVMREGKAYINEYCESCMACIGACPEGAIIEATLKSPEGRGW